MGGKASKDSSKYQLRVLVLGVAACGKSTFSRQMKILYCDGFSDDELTNYKNIMQNNLCLGFKEILAKSEEHGIALDKKVKKAARFFEETNAYTTSLTDEVVDKAKKLWSDQGIKDTLAKIGKFEYFESLNYVMENLSRISGPDWKLTNEDVLHIRQRTTGIVETRFKIDKYQWVIIDVGGQKVERRKWIHSLQNLTALIYFVAMDEYDIQSDDEVGKTKMEESLGIWDETINSEALQPNLPVILFLNKRDLFEEKIKTVPLKKTYKKYKGGKDFEKAVEYVRDLFLTKLEGSRVDPDQCYYHVTVCTDTSNISVVFQSVKDFIFRQRLKISGL